MKLYQRLFLKIRHLQIRRRLKIFYASQVSVAPPKFLIFVNEPELCHFSYIRYLENSIRQKFGFIGTPIKLELRRRGE